MPRTKKMALFTFVCKYKLSSNCEGAITIEAKDKKTSKESATTEGWNFVDDKFLCPQCKKEIKIAA